MTTNENFSKFESETPKELILPDNIYKIFDRISTLVLLCDFQLEHIIETCEDNPFHLSKEELKEALKFILKDYFPQNDLSEINKKDIKSVYDFKKDEFNTDFTSFECLKGLKKADLENNDVLDKIMQNVDEVTILFDYMVFKTSYKNNNEAELSNKIQLSFKEKIKNIKNKISDVLSNGMKSIEDAIDEIKDNFKEIILGIVIVGIFIGGPALYYHVKHNQPMHAYVDSRSALYDMSDQLMTKYDDLQKEASALYFEMRDSNKQYPSEMFAKLEELRENIFSGQRGIENSVYNMKMEEIDKFNYSEEYFVELKESFEREYVRNKKELENLQKEIAIY